MSQLSTTAELLPSSSVERAVRVRDLAGKFVFGSLAVLIPITAIPYGSVEVWWKAFFICAVLLLTIVWLIDGPWRGVWLSDGVGLLAPMMALVLFALIQTVDWSWTQSSAGGLNVWNAISADPFQTRFFAVQLLSLTLAAALLFNYLSTRLRLRILITLIVAVAGASAVFGIFRQASQRALGFALPLLATNQGYGQFINKNHFAYLMEMGLGLTLGFALAGGAKREHLLVYGAALLAMWSALGLSGSRGGLVAMLAQVVVAVLVLSFVRRGSRPKYGLLAKFSGTMAYRLMLMLVLVGAVVVGTLWLGGDRLATKIEHTGEDFAATRADTRDAVSRKEIWRATLKMFAAHPIAGVGMGAYWVAIPKFHDASGRYTPQEAHNDYLELLASGGLVAALIAVWFAIVFIRRAKQNLQSPDRLHRAACLGGLVAITGVAVHSVLDFGLHALANAFIFTTLIVITTSKPAWATLAADRKL